MLSANLHIYYLLWIFDQKQKKNSWTMLESAYNPAATIIIL